MVITPDNYLGTETTNALTQFGKRGNIRQHSAGKLLKKPRVIAPDLILR